VKAHAVQEVTVNQSEDSESTGSKKNSRNDGNNDRDRDRNDPPDRENEDDREGSGHRRDKKDRHRRLRDSSPDDSLSPSHHRIRYHFHKHWIKAQEFDGLTSFDNFLVTFENAAKFNR